MTEKRFAADGVTCIMIWKVSKDGVDRVPFLRIYEPKDPATGEARWKSDGGYPSFKDFQVRSLTDPSFKIIDKAGAFEFIEDENGNRYFDFSEKALGR